MADLQTIFYQIVLSILRDSKFTSASPGHVNQFTGVEGAFGEIGTEEEIKQAIQDIIEKLDIDTDGDEKINKISKRDTGRELAQTVRVGENPMSLILSNVKQLIPVILPLLIAAGIGKTILDTSLSPGGLWDRRLRRMITEEFNGLLDKQTQKNFQIGTRQITIQSRAGFRNIQGH